MKKILYIVLGAILVSVTSCMEIDNWDEPGVQVYGQVIDAYTGENLLSSQDEWGIRIWERTWDESVPNHQSLSVKQDGSYNNSKLFAGTYDMLPYGGPFWPVDTIKNIQFGGSTQKDFTVTPYLQLTDFEVVLNGLELTLKCRLNAPIREGLPNLVEIKPFISLNTFCGATNYINIGEYNNKRKQINRSWIEEVGDVESSDLYRIGSMPVKAGYTYYVRLGANVNDANRKYNYTEIIKVEVPADAVNDPNAIPDNYLKNADYPFAMDTWDDNRWGTLTNWVTNDAIRSRGDGLYGGYDGGYGDYQGGGCPSFGFERWGEAENTIINGKIYQTFTLPAGTYQYKFSFGGENPLKSNNGSDPRFIVAAVGETLPDVESIDNSLAHATLVDVSVDDAVTVEFTLDQETTVSVGLVINWTNTEQNIRTSSLKLEKVE